MRQIGDAVGPNLTHDLEAHAAIVLAEPCVREVCSAVAQSRPMSGLMSNAL